MDFTVHCRLLVEMDSEGESDVEKEGSGEGELEGWGESDSEGDLSGEGDGSLGASINVLPCFHWLANWQQKRKPMYRILSLSLYCRHENEECGYLNKEFFHKAFTECKKMYTFPLLWQALNCNLATS